ncbi:hypothetical protein BP6252_11253 [Coleophoma cylindrospora]|uniref:Uncharacterized protein n=1 Tax=Coleophoma cylindrospora TaxID=1849047 RepID=A0A3D8QPV1_9HELO|nr:hypothetical protein BP6252_11253 [Coleophoma cylindrospora]
MLAAGFFTLPPEASPQPSGMMRLLNTDTLQLSSFFGAELPPYVTLSHTWGSDEVLFADIQEGTARNKSGFRKVRGCCRKAAADDFAWVWIDTCCIDKSSSAELSEAINSMYQWYKASVICYVYLEDISTAGTHTMPRISPFVGWTKSRWFTRGWTLQELIAPPILEFYSEEWVEIGTKASLSEQVSNITGVPIPILRGEDPSTCTIAHRMSWASKRQTTREEDIAYCLLGIFGVNMPMLYGEGSKAFKRLQEEILKQNEDYTLFAWSLRYDCSPLLTGILASSPADFSKSVPMNLQKPMPADYIGKLDELRVKRDRLNDESEREEITNLIEKIKRLTVKMAEDPVPLFPYEISYEKNYDKLTSIDQLSLTKNNWTRKFPASLAPMRDPPQQTSRGLRISLPVKVSKDNSSPSMAWLYCFLEERPVCIFIDQPKSSANLYGRQNSSWLVTVAPDQLEEFQVTEIYMHPSGVMKSSIVDYAEPEQVWGRIKLVHEDHSDSTAALLSVYPPQHWNLDEIFYNGQPRIFGALLFECTFENSLLYFAVVIGQHNGAPWCEAYSRGTNHENDDSFGSTRLLEDLVAEVSHRESFADFSDRSTVSTRNAVSFSAALRQRPSPNNTTTLYTLHTSTNSINTLN